MANLQIQLGFQSLLFACQAILNPFPNFFCLNGAVLSWYFLFVLKKITFIATPSDTTLPETLKSYRKWFLLFAFTMLSWTQVRLTAASISPDFIVTLYILAAFFCYKKTEACINNGKYLFLATIFSCGAVAVKLSSIAIISLPVIMFLNCLYKRKTRTAILIILITFAILVPLLIKNFIASGYVLYPSFTFDFFHPDWKLNPLTVKNLQHYITSYARYSTENNEAANNTFSSFLQWLPKWRNQQTLIDQILFYSILITGMINVLFIKTTLHKMRGENIVIFFIAITGSLIWFLKAPDFRFGTGFLLSLLYTLLNSLPEITNFTFHKLGVWAFRSSVMLLLTAITSYTVYRFIRYSTCSEIIFPAGIKKGRYTKLYMSNNMEINISKDSIGCGIIPEPCLSDTNITFLPRGRTISDGFKSKSLN
ncbi:MAG TPA: hypothetical protein VMT76_10000 [Puia sp.]|nr:hypothetical protein [Puia sp.]